MNVQMMYETLEDFFYHANKVNAIQLIQEPGNKQHESVGSPQETKYHSEGTSLKAPV
jgi:hypothetical protein